jgi:hypothetical protein
MGCVIDAALAADEVTLAAGDDGITVALDALAPITGCAALARIGDATWAATLGVGAGEPARGKAPRWQRAADYLATAPLALAADLGDRHVIAAAATDPLDAWLTLDAADPAAGEAAVRALVAAWPPRVATKLAIERRGDQLLVRGRALAEPDLAAIAGALRSAIEAAPQASVTPLPCPPADPLVVACTGARLEVRGLAPALHAMLSTAIDPVVSGGDVIGLRLAAKADLMLPAGDILRGIDGRAVTTVAQRELAEALAAKRGRTTLAIRHQDRDLAIEVVERPAGK